MDGIILSILLVGLFIFFIIKRIKRVNNRSSSSQPIMTIDDKYNEGKVKTKKEIDRLLDKVGKSGYDSLTKVEKRLLKKYSDKI